MLRGRRGGLFLLLPLPRGTRLTGGCLPLLVTLLLLVLGRLDAVHQLEQDQRRVVAGAAAGPDEARVAAVALAEAWGDRAEQLAHDLRVRHHREDLPPRVEGVALRERDHLLGEPTHGLRLGLGRLDALVPEEGHQEISGERPAVGGDAPELEAVPPVPHRGTPPPRAPRWPSGRSPRRGGGLGRAAAV